MAEKKVTEALARKALAHAGVTSDATLAQISLVSADLAKGSGKVTILIRNPANETVMEIPAEEIGGVAFLPMTNVIGLAKDASKKDMEVFRAFFG